MKRACLILLLGLPTLDSYVGADVLRTLRMDSRGYTYVAPTADELTVAASLFRHLLAGEENLARVIPLCRELELDLILLEDEGERLLILMELEAARRGRGFYVFRQGRSQPCMLQMPHAFHDLHTGAIGRRLFLESDVAVAAWNSVDRSRTVAGGTEKSDLAHLEASYFQTLTAVFAEVYPKGQVFQVHGFSKEKRSTIEGALSDVILSNGTRAPDRWIRTRANCISEQLPFSLAVYPRDVSELGGTTNVQATLLRKAPRCSFLHLELSLEVRRRLLKSREDRRHFWRCLTERAR